MKSTFYLFIFFVVIHTTSFAQGKFVHSSVEGQTIATSNEVPFWLRSNQFGSIPLSGISASVIGRLVKVYDTTHKKLVDWGVGFEGRTNAGEKAEFLLIEAYGKVRIGIFELKAGRSKDVLGLVDTSLSSGSIAVSGNALGVPKVQLAIPDFYSLPFWGHLLAFKGDFAHGWIGDASLHYFGNPITEAKTYLHQSSFYGRIGKPSWKIKLIGGITHLVLWGSDSTIFGSQFPYSNWHAFPYVVTGRKYLGATDISKIGNHLGSIDLGFEFITNKLKIFAYRQHFYDKGAIYRLANIADGLNGISIVNRTKVPNKFNWSKVLLEVLYTKNQGADVWTPSGPEYYYNHEVYKQGYSYKNLSLGTPFFSTRTYTKEGLPAVPRDYFINNRVLLLHLGFMGAVQNWIVTSKISFSKNYGTYGTSSTRMLYTINGQQYLHVPAFGVFPETKQLSAYFEATKELKKGLTLGLAAAFDAGKLYENTFGTVLKLSKSF